MSTDRLAPVVRFAPAKLNLTLAVLGRRPDGFHDLHSVMVPLDFGDWLSLAPAAGGADTLHVEERDGETGDPARFGSVLLGIAAARRAAGRSIDAVPIATRLRKGIPVAAGLAGGSSDAAAAIEGAFELWGAEPSPELRRAAAASVGSDVPFFLAAGPALVEGRGDRVTALGLGGEPPGVLLVVPAAEVPTPAVFDRHDRTSGAAGRGATLLTSQHLAAEMRAGLRGADLVARAGVLAVANDLASAADELLPGLRSLRRALSRLLGAPIGLSGSGPTLFALYPSSAAAHAAAEAVEAAIGAGRLEAPGGRPPLVAATSIGRPAGAAGDDQAGRHRA